MCSRWVFGWNSREVYDIALWSFFLWIYPKGSRKLVGNSRYILLIRCFLGQHWVKSKYIYLELSSFKVRNFWNTIELAINCNTLLTSEGTFRKNPPTTLFSSKSINSKKIIYLLSIYIGNFPHNFHFIIKCTSVKAK